MDIDLRFSRIQDAKKVVLIDNSQVYEVKEILLIDSEVLVDIGNNVFISDMDLMTVEEAGETYKLLDYIKIKLLKI